MKSSSKTQLRNNRASFIAEAPIAIWLLLFMFTLPFIDMASILLRYTFFVAAARDGVHAAARSKTFLMNPSSSQLSAINTAPPAVALTANSFTEISISNVATRILETNITTRQVRRYTSPLTAPADSSINLYELETVVTGQINPLLTVNSYFPMIPGLTAPVPVVVAAREYCEYPQGLNQ